MDHKINGIAGITAGIAQKTGSVRTCIFYRYFKNFIWLENIRKIIK